MTDAIPAAGEAPESPPAPQAPGLSETQIVELVERKAQEISDRRVAGLQSLYDRKIKELRDENQRIQRSLAGTEDDARSSDLEAELRRQERENKYLRVALENPDLAPFISRFDPESSPEDIATALKEYRQSFSQPANPTTPPPPAQQDPVPGVEPNQPRRDTTGWEPGQSMTQELANRILGIA